jgi:phosphatidylglycerophosphatase A
MRPKLSLWIATCFNIGKLPLAPGTWGSVLALLLWFTIIGSIRHITFFFLTIILFGLGVFISTIALRYFDQDDPQQIVIDEFVGQWIALLFVQKSIVLGLTGFILFRIFDIWKPWIIGKMDKISGGWGVMLDDAVAGIISLGLLHLFRMTLA